MTRLTSTTRTESVFQLRTGAGARAAVGKGAVGNQAERYRYTLVSRASKPTFW
jgi:hypothetical protein